MSASAISKLKLAFLECYCGWASFLLHRMDNAMAKGRFPTAGKLKPSEYFKRQCWISTEHEKELPMIIDLIGDDNIVFSTDYPHGDSDFPRGWRSSSRWTVSRMRAGRRFCGIIARGCMGWADNWGILDFRFWILDWEVQGSWPSLAQPGGNVTGPRAYHRSWVPKGWKSIKDAVPKLARVGLLRSTQEANRRYQTNLMSLGLRLQALKLKLEEINTEPNAKGIEIAFPNRETEAGARD